MWRIFGGALLVVAGIAAFIEASSHRPIAGEVEVSPFDHKEILRVLKPPEGLSHTAYDLLRIGAWALVIFGGVLLIVGLIVFARDRGKP